MDVLFDLHAAHSLFLLLAAMFACATLLVWTAMAAADFINTACVVKEALTGEDKPCKFPFTVAGEVHNECVFDSQHAVDGAHHGEVTSHETLWCSTRTTPDHFHIENLGYWGKCSKECIAERQSMVSNGSTSQETLTSEGAALLLRLEEMSSLVPGDTECPCATFNECSSVAELIRIGKALPEGDSVRSAIQMKLRLLKCCHSQPKDVNRLLASNKKRQYRQSESSEPDEVINRTNSQPWDSGTWLPLSSSGECGLRLRPFYPEILGGREAEVGEFPFAALLGYTHNGRVVYACGASLINNLYVLTAAHCHNNPKPIHEIVLGELDLGSAQDCDSASCAPPVQRRAPAKVIVPEKWDKENFAVGFDIALVRMDRPAVTFLDNEDNWHIVPVCLPLPSDPDLPADIDSLAGQATTVVGWGKVTNNYLFNNNYNYDKLSAGVRTMQKLAITVQNSSTCKDHYSRFWEERQLCSGGKQGKDTCDGDSGGPQLFRVEFNTAWFQVGIVSYGSIACGDGEPAIYTRLSHYVDWIVAHLEP